MAADRIHLSVAEAREHAERALHGIGYDGEEARIFADHVLDAALCGYEHSGLAKILNIPEHRRFKQPRHPMTAVRETEVSVLFDGGNEIRIPGERALRSRERLRREGIEIDRLVYDALAALHA